MIVVQTHHTMTEHEVPGRRVCVQVHGSDRVDPLAKADEDTVAHHAMQRLVAHSSRYGLTAQHHAPVVSGMQDRIDHGASVARDRAVYPEVLWALWTRSRGALDVESQCLSAASDRC